MNVTLQRHCARYIYVVPEGLRELMSDISREVLRSEPEDIYTFIADYLDALLITRENARVSARFVQYLTEAAETIVELLKRTGMSREEASKSAEVIQETFRTWSSRKGILKEDEDVIVAKIIEEAGISPAQVETAAAVIQHAFRAFKVRQQKEAQLLSGIIDWRVAARSAIRLYRRTGVSPEEAKRAANLIKAAYKGYYTRRAIRVLNEQLEEEEEGGEFGSEEDMMSQGSSERKSKGVRIDYSSVVPHVDFGGEELISKDMESLKEQEIELPQHEDVMARIFGEEAKDKKTDEEFIIEILNDIIRSVVCEEELLELPTLDDRDSDTDNFIPPISEEHHVQNYNRPLIMPIVPQDDLESELEQAEKEMNELKDAKTSVGKGTVDEELTEKPQVTDDNKADKVMVETTEEQIETIKQESTDKKDVETDQTTTEEKPVETADETSRKGSTEEKPAGTEETSRKGSTEEKPAETEETSRKGSTGEKPAGTEETSRKGSIEEKPAGTEETSRKGSTEEKPVGTDETSRKGSTEEKPVEKDETVTEENPELQTQDNAPTDAPVLTGNETNEESIPQPEPTQPTGETSDEPPTEHVNETTEE